MTIKNIEYRRWYKKIWARRKSAGLDTKKIRSLLPEKIQNITKEQKIYKTPEEKKKSKNIQSKQYRIKKKKIKDKIRKKYLTTHCYICNRNEYKLLAHRKDGLAHKDFCTLSAENLEIELSSGEYINLCYACHKGVHWVMKNFNYDWKQILDKIKTT